MSDSVDKVVPIGWNLDNIDPQSTNAKPCRPSGHEKKKRHSSTSSSSSSSSSSSDEKLKKKGHKTPEERQKAREERRRKRKERKELKKLSKEAYKKAKKEQKLDEKIKKKEKKSKRKKGDSSDDCGVPIELMTGSKMVPETKEEYDARQSKIRRVVDHETGRTRLIKGDGEILEEIVSRNRHKEINKMATKNDGNFFESQTLVKKKT